MAIRRQTEAAPESKKEYRSLLDNFIRDESGIKALQSLISPDNSMSREGMYLLEILNNVIQSKNGTKNVFQRIPQEVFGGLPEGGRRNVQASLIGRAVSSPDKEEQRRVLASGYTRIQEIIGSWAERDGSWTDTPEGDLVNKGYNHVFQDDGSEARVFSKQGSAQLIKTIDFSHYSDFELMLDRIAIHNSVFPEMAMTVKGFGIRDDAEDNSGFVVIVSQKKAEGTAPTMEEITDSMKERFFDRTDNGFFFVSGFDNIVVADIHDQNAVKTPKGKILVFDCEAFLKTFPIDRITPESLWLKDLLPNKSTGRYDDEAWKVILGDALAAATNQDKSEIIRELRTTGKCTGLINGKTIMMDNPRVSLQKSPDGRTLRFFDSTKVLVGPPRTFVKEHTWEIPELQFNENRVSNILKAVRALSPMEVNIDNFLYAERYVGPMVANRYGGGEYRKNYLEQLKTTGHIEGLVNGRYIVELNPHNPDTVLVSDSRKADFMLWSHTHDLPELGTLTDTEKKELANGVTIEKGGRTIRFSLDKGRVDEALLVQRKLKIGQAKEKQKEPLKNKKPRLGM